MWRPGGLRPPGEACERCGALVAVLVSFTVLPGFFSSSPASLGDSVHWPLFFGCDCTSLRWRKGGVVGATVQRGLVPMFVCLIFSASWTRRLASFERSTAARELATYYFSWYMRKSAAKANKKYVKLG